MLYSLRILSFVCLLLAGCATTKPPEEPRSLLDRNNEIADEVMERAKVSPSFCAHARDVVKNYMAELVSTGEVVPNWSAVCEGKLLTVKWHLSLKPEYEYVVIYTFGLE